jgi:trimeric autotransporter adhesin
MRKFGTWLSQFQNRSLLTRTKKTAKRRCAFELLEDRITPATILGANSLLEGPTAGIDSDIVGAVGAWTASPNSTWLHTSASGTGNGVATFTFDANSGATRTGELTIAGQTLTITQAGNDYVPANPETPLFSLGTGTTDYAIQSNNVYVLYESDGSIVKWNITTQSSTTIQTGLTLDGIAVDAVGNIYLADTQSDAIDEWKASTKTISPLFSTASKPLDVAVDSGGNVFASETGAVLE